MEVATTMRKEISTAPQNAASTATPHPNKVQGVSPP